MSCSLADVSEIVDGRLTVKLHSVAIGTPLARRSDALSRNQRWRPPWLHHSRMSRMCAGAAQMARVLPHRQSHRCCLPQMNARLRQGWGVTRNCSQSHHETQTLLMKVGPSFATSRCRTCALQYRRLNKLRTSDDAEKLSNDRSRTYCCIYTQKPHSRSQAHMPHS